jgi:hypothetical protein
MRAWIKRSIFLYLLAQPSIAMAGAGAATWDDVRYAPSLRDLAGSIISWANGLGEKAKAGALSWLVGKAETEFKFSAGAGYLALLTVEWKYSQTGSTFTEPGTGPTEYEGYARKKITWKEVILGEEAEIYNEAKEEFAALTGSGAGAKIIGWGLATAATAGVNIAGGTCTETTISKANSPAYVNAKELKIKIK